MKILDWLDNASCIADYVIFDYKHWKSGYFIKIENILIDDSRLYIKEYVDINERNYSYHWQDKDQKLIICWDNSPHHKDVLTFPHHKHQDEKALESQKITIKDILRSGSLTEVTGVTEFE